MINNKNKFDGNSVLAEISKERFLEIMLEYAYDFSENPEIFSLDYISRATGIQIREFKPKKLESGDKYLIKRDCIEYLEKFMGEGRLLITHNARISGLRVALFDRKYYEYE